jgi:hypothetical protein
LEDFVGKLFGFSMIAMFTVACADDDGAALPVEGELQQVIGPEGGTIDGTGVPGFDGVRVVIPPGALAEDTTVVVRPIAEATPLPQLGEQCGQSYQVDGGGATLSAAIEVTLPVDPSIVEDFGETSEGVKVWAKEGDAWQSIEPKTTDEGTVTFDLDRFASSAAGVRRKLGENFCALTTAACGSSTETPPASSCPGPAFCITSLGTGMVAESGARMTTDGTSLYYTARPATNQVTVVRVGTTSAAGTPAAPFTSSSTVRRNLAIPKNTGEAWLGIGVGGNIRFKFDGSTPVAFDTDALGQGAVVLDDGTLTRISSLGLTTRQTGSTSFEARATPAGLAGGSLQDVGHCHADGDYATRTQVFTFQFATGILEVIPNPNSTTVASTVGFPMGVRAHHRPALGRSGGTGFQAFAQPGVQKLVVVEQGGGEPQVIDGMPPGVDAIVDDLGNVWIAATSTPELGLVRNVLDPGSRSLEMVPLTSAAPGTAEFINHLPRGIVELADGRIAIQTLNGELLLLRRPG